MVSSHASEETSVREGLAALARRVQTAGLVVATDGNVSARLRGGRFLITPTGVRKDAVTPESLVLCGASGSPCEARGNRPSSEVRMHVAIYEERSDVRVICHAHPPTAVALSLAGKEIAACLLPEILIAVGRVVTAPYSTPTSADQARAVRLPAREADAIVLDRHGSVTLGRTFDEAFHHLERLEWSARVTRDAWLVAGGAAGLQRLAPAEVEQLLEVRAKLQGKTRPDPCNLCGVCVAETRDAPAGSGARLGLLG